MLQSGSIKHGVGGNTPRLQSRAIADCVGGFRCNYNFRFAGDKPSYNCNVPGSSEGVYSIIIVSFHLQCHRLNNNTNKIKSAK